MAWLKAFWIIYRFIAFNADFMLDWFDLGFEPEIEWEESLDEQTSDVASFPT